MPSWWHIYSEKLGRKACKSSTKSADQTAAPQSLYRVYLFLYIVYMEYFFCFVIWI